MTKIYNRLIFTPYQIWYRKQFSRAIELGLPIPHTACFRGGGHFHRKPKNNGANMEDNNSYDHHFKKVKIPPNAWDDLKISANRNRNWKRHRKTQWKVK